MPRPGPVTVVTRPVENARELADWARREGFEDLRPEVWHVTVILADRNTALSLDAGSLTLEPDLNRAVVRMVGLVVLTLLSHALSGRHALHRQAGGRWDFSTYRPHISFAPDDGRALGPVRPFAGAVVLGPEMVDSGFA